MLSVERQLGGSGDFAFGLMHCVSSDGKVLVDTGRVSELGVDICYTSDPPSW